MLWGLILLQLVLPFFALLSERVRYGRRPLILIAAITLALRPVEACLLVLPGTKTDGAMLALDVPSLTIALGALWWLAMSVVHPRADAASAVQADQ
jgi:hypothetical protein